MAVQPFSVDLREVKEVRIGKSSKDFEKWPEDAKKMDNPRCFVVYYGSEFRLKTLSIAGKTIFVKNKYKLKHCDQTTINALLYAF